MADRTHAYQLIDTLMSFRTALQSSRRLLKAAIENSPCSPAADERTKEAIRACAADVRNAAAEIQALAAELEARLSLNEVPQISTDL